MDWLELIFKACVCAFLFSQIAMDKITRERLDLAREDINELWEKVDGDGNGYCGDEREEGERSLDARMD